MRQKILIPVISALLGASSLTAFAQTAGPFARPSVVSAKASVSNPSPGADVATSLPAAGQVVLSAAQKEEEERLKKEEAEAAEEEKRKEQEAIRRKKLGLKEGQDLVEREFKGARIGQVNGVNIYRANDSGQYFFESEDKRKYLYVLSKESVSADPKAPALAATTPGKRGAQGEKVPDLPNSVGRPAPRN